MGKTPEAFRTISEVAGELDVPKHVLRFWEQKFSQVRPMKRGGGRRYYRPEDLDLLRGIRDLLHADGYTIKGVQRILRERGVDAVKNSAVDGAESDDADNLPLKSRGRPTGRRTSSQNRSSRTSAEIAGRPLIEDDSKLADVVHGAGPSGSGAVGAGLDAKQMRVLLAAIAELGSCRATLAGDESAASSSSATGKIASGSSASGRASKARRKRA